MKRIQAFVTYKELEVEFEIEDDATDEEIKNYAEDLAFNSLRNLEVDEIDWDEY